ncbi:CCA tRNA nucleotidyltransferase [Aestuariicoccus sp. MJ-SS9]|uniref:CCA tRNA nucleotidyltransferase n=1 Tax=Aestuariicoccus sp. MJ-SS9 TaxID=3079855 RepID=UPI0029090956|nr:CCA tRNA nucleotidyltransferase [Aestuariicoccus sp. MJ-SS9]MDU8910883.1 CCA tRNA nucleotidyltransferase [Aestuariicoccus sp. MJ-SS9]
MTRVTGDWLTAPATQRVLNLLTDAGHQALVVGGCVRNALLGVPVSDVDIATDAVPERVIALAEAAGLKPVPTGIDHGTVTVVTEGEGLEVTTFRKDVETDGRRAVVHYSTRIEDDALRRDFTMNALYARADGTVIDPLGGLPDLEARKVRFIEDATTRIREDYLRTLRFFRFTAWYADPETGFDADALAAIADTLDGLETLSRERIGGEVMRLLGAPDPAQAVAIMARTGVLTRIMPRADSRALGPLVAAEAALGLTADPVRRLVSLGQVDPVGLRLSKDRQRRVALYQSLISGTETLAEIAYRHDIQTALSTLALRSAMLETPLTAPDTVALKAAENARLPVKARDLMPEYQGPALGARLQELETRWIASGFTLTREALLASEDER